MFPLIIASVTAYAASVLLLDRSILTEKIARRGLHLTSDYTTDPLETFFVDDVMHPEPSHTPAAGTVSPRDTLRHAANIFAASGGDPLRVVATDGTEQGHLRLQDILPAWLHDLNEATDRNRYLNAFVRRPARRGSRGSEPQPVEGRAAPVQNDPPTSSRPR
jgi:hypothetical protein